MNSPHAAFGQNILDSHGVLNCTTAFRNDCWLSLLSRFLKTVLGTGCVQQRGGILDSSVVACWTTTLRQELQNEWLQGRACRAFGFSNVSRQQIHELFLALAKCATELRVYSRARLTMLAQMAELTAAAISFSF